MYMYSRKEKKKAAHGNVKMQYRYIFPQKVRYSAGCGLDRFEKSDPDPIKKGTGTLRICNTG